MSRKSNRFRSASVTPAASLPTIAVPAPPSVRRRLPLWPVLVVLSLTLVIGASFYLVAAFRTRSGEEVCRHFQDLKNAHAPHAEQLLASAAPVVPSRPISSREAERLDAEIMLHQDLHIRSVHPDRGYRGAPPRFVLEVEGAVSSERLQVQTPSGIETAQRVMWNPDLIVEVRDGKIHGVKARLHED